MSNDIVARLRVWSADESTWDLLTEAADEIERLRAALQEIAWIATPDHEEARHKATEIARAALGEASDDAAT